MITFAKLKAEPGLLTPTMRSPIFHGDGTMTVLWEGDPGEGGPMCLAEWMERPLPLAQIPDTLIWGGDFPAPPIPYTVISFVRVGRPGQMLPSPRHQIELRGAALPAPLPQEGEASTLAADVLLPAPGLAGDERRVRIFVPPGYQAGQPLATLYMTDGQFGVDQHRWFPRISDTLRHRGEMPPVILVLMDNGGPDRPEEYLIGGARNDAARRWVWEQVVPYVDQRWPSAQRLVAAGSNGASMGAQLVLGRPDLFAGAALYSPLHEGGLDEVLGMAERWPGGGRFYVSHGNFGRGEQGALEGSRQLVERLAAAGATTRFLERDGHGHNLHAWGLSWPDALRWLLSDAGA